MRSILIPPWHSALPKTKVEGIAAGQEMKNSVLAGTLTGCPNPQSCRYKHVCIYCSSTQHKGKSCSGSANADKSKK